MKKCFFLAVVLPVLALLAACGMIESENEQKLLTDVPAEAISISRASLDMYIGEENKLDASVMPQRSGVKASFSSSNESVVDVREDGVVCALSPGEAIVFARAGVLSASCKVVVSRPPAESLSIEGSSMQLKVGEQLRVSVEVSPSAAETEDLVYFTDDERIATVDETGLVTAVGVGLTSIGAYVPENETVRAVAELTTSCDCLQSMSFKECYYALAPGSKASPELSLYPFGMSADKITFISSDESVAVVDGNGVVTGVSDGLARITASSPDGMTTECYIGVTQRLAPEPLSSISDGRYSLEKDVYEELDQDGEEGKAFIMLGGDITAMENQQLDAETDGVYDFSRSFKYLKPIFAKSDLSLASLHSLLSYSSKYACEEAKIGNELNVNAPSTLLGALRYAGLDALATANDSCADADAVGVLETIQQLERYNIQHTGTRAFSNDDRYLLFNVNGIRVGVLSYTKNLSVQGRLMSAQNKSAMLGLYTKTQMESDVDILKERGAEYIIAYIHWGDEGSESVSSNQRKCAQEMANAGVDVVAGTHPGCLQGAEYITGDSGKKTLVVYSLGNLVTGDEDTKSKDSVIICLNLERSWSGIELSGASYISLRVIGSYNGGSYVTVPVSHELNGGDQGSSLETVGKRIEEIFADIIMETTSLW